MSVVPPKAVVKSGEWHVPRRTFADKRWTRTSCGASLAISKQSRKTATGGAVIDHDGQAPFSFLATGVKVAGSK
jgi:hypothetical protein